MRRLVPVIVNNLVVRWKCDGCHWGFCLRNPVALAAYSDYTIDVVQNAFSAHDCFCHMPPSNPATARTVKIASA